MSKNLKKFTDSQFPGKNITEVAKLVQNTDRNTLKELYPGFSQAKTAGVWGRVITEARKYLAGIPEEAATPLGTVAATITTQAISDMTRDEILDYLEEKYGATVPVDDEEDWDDYDEEDKDWIGGLGYSPEVGAIHPNYQNAKVIEKESWTTFRSEHNTPVEEYIKFLNESGFADNAREVFMMNQNEISSLRFIVKLVSSEGNELYVSTHNSADIEVVLTEFYKRLYDCLDFQQLQRQDLMERSIESPETDTGSPKVVKVLDEGDIVRYRVIQVILDVYTK